MDEALLDYVRNLFAVEDDHLTRIRQRTEEEGLPTIGVRPEEGRMLQVLMAAVGARRVVEIGTLAGYSGTWIARALPDDGKLITFEADEHHAQVARQLFEEGGLAEKVDIHVGPALDHLRSIDETVDAVFIDADKDSYPAYLAWAMDHVRPGGLITAHNAFMRGRVIDPDAQDEPGVRNMRAFNQTVARDERLTGMILPFGDGLTIAVVR
ncbi:MAG: O-methyltransferase [Chloroflexi bacterium]|nr:O-methyltransferase [Chloroflexota bacterium]